MRNYLLSIDCNDQMSIDEEADMTQYLHDLFVSLDMELVDIKFLGEKTTLNIKKL